MHTKLCPFCRSRWKAPAKSETAACPMCQGLIMAVRYANHRHLKQTALQKILGSVWYSEKPSRKKPPQCT